MEEKNGKRKGRKKEKIREEKEKGNGIEFLPKGNHQIAQNKYRNSKIFQLIRGTSPLDTPCARKCALGTDVLLGGSLILPPWTVTAGSTPA